MKSPVLLAAALVVLTYQAEAQKKRQLDAHQHGHGTLNIAIEGNRVTMELEVPGADIVGFEHAATTSAQKDAVSASKTKLADPLQLFKVSAAANCRLQEANVEIVTGSEADKDSKAGKHAGKESSHSEFRALYGLECTSPDKLAGIDFAYFNTFSAAKELEVNLTTSKGQTKFRVTRAKPRISLSGQVCARRLRRDAGLC